MRLLVEPHGKEWTCDRQWPAGNGTGPRVVKGVTGVARVGVGAGSVALAARWHCGGGHSVRTAAAHGAPCSLCPRHVLGALPVLTDLSGYRHPCFGSEETEAQVVWVVQQDV